MRILIAEDDAISAHYLERLLARFGTCVLADDGDVALTAYREALARGDPFQLVCLDVMMPRQDGQAVLEDIRRLERERGVVPEAAAKVVMTTALADVRSAAAAYSGGATAYIVKPIVAERLFETLHGLGIDVSPAADDRIHAE